MKLIKSKLLKNIKLLTSASVFILLSKGALANEVTVHPCTSELLPLTEKVQLIDAVECLFDASIIKLDPISTTLQRTKPEYKGKKIFKARFLQGDGKVRNMLVDLLTGLPIDEAVLTELNIQH